MLDEQQVSYFLYWVLERHRIHLRRKAGEPKPWSKDPIFQTRFFTNPFRENDKTTQWARKWIRDPLADSGKVLMAMFIFRRFNYIPTGQLLLDAGLLESWNSREAWHLLSGQPKVFTGAFMISSPNGKSKLSEVCRMIDDVWWQKDTLLTEMEEATTLEEGWRLLQFEHHKGLMPYELITDLRWTYLMQDATDKMAWAYFGPGAQRGCCRLIGQRVDGAVPRPMSQEQALDIGRELLEITEVSLGDLDEFQGENLPESWKERNFDESSINQSSPFELREIEHSICEYSKYMVASEGGRSKRRYDGEAE